MREKPILFSASMVQAIQDGRKSMTRRVVKPQPPHIKYWVLTYFDYDKNGKPMVVCPDNTDNSGIKAWADKVKVPYQPGDLLWVRETWWRNYSHEYGRYWYRADGEEIEIPTINGRTATYGNADGLKWKPSIHMPKAAARIWLEVVNVRVERLQEIGVEDVIGEGLEADNEIFNPDLSTHESIENWNLAWAQHVFRELWDKINAKRGYGWETNPWVWVIEFRRVAK